MHTSYFPAFRPQLAPCRQRATQQIRQATLAQLEHFLQGIFPPHLLAQEDAGDNSRDRIFNLCLTLQCFLWQVFKPKTACREVVRQVQALFRLLGRGPVDEGTSASCNAAPRAVPAPKFGTAARSAAASAATPFSPFCDRPRGFINSLRRISPG
jgi:hypothetical protein